MGATPTFDLYVDDSGSRLPDHPNRELRRDGMDAFALGGVIVAAEDAPRIYDLVEKFRAELDLAYPLHSHKIRSVLKSSHGLERTKRGRTNSTRELRI